MIRVKIHSSPAVKRRAIRRARANGRRNYFWIGNRAVMCKRAKIVLFLFFFFVLLIEKLCRVGERYRSLIGIILKRIVRL